MTVPAPDERLPGSFLGNKWQIVQRLGTGGMASVYEAQHRNGKRVAIKILHTDLIPEKNAIERFLREGYLTNAIEHPGVVSVLDDGMTEEGAPYLVMEFLEGEDLGRRLRRLGKPLNIPDVMAIAVALLDALTAAHEAEIVHRDLKPDNVFLCADGPVKVLDFGIARLLASARGDTKPMTETGVALGTVQYMAREQALGELDQIDAQTDLWALGATLYQALSLQYLYESRSNIEFLAQLLQNNPRPIEQVNPELPTEIAEVINRALRHDKRERWASAAAMREALNAAIARSGMEVPRWPSLAGFEPPPRPKSKPRNFPEAPPATPPPTAPEETEARRADTQKIRATPGRFSLLTVLLTLTGTILLGLLLLLFLRPTQDPAANAASLPSRSQAAPSPPTASALPLASVSATVSAAVLPPPLPVASQAPALAPHKVAPSLPKNPIDIGNSRH